MVQKVTIRLYRNYKIVSEFDLPEYRFGRHDLYELMRSIYVSQISSDPQDMARFYVNKRRGTPVRPPYLELTEIRSEEALETGLMLGTAQLNVTSTYKHTKEKYELLKRLWAQSAGSE